MRNKRSIILLVTVIMLLQLVLIPVSADTGSYFTTPGAGAYRLRTIYDLVNTGDYTAVSVKATVMVGAVSDSPYQQSMNYKVTPTPKYTYVDPAGNIYAEVVVSEIKPKETVNIIVEREFMNSGISYSDDIYDMEPDYSQFKKIPGNNQYYEPGQKIESTAQEIAKKAQDFDLGKNTVNIAKDIYDFVNLYISYDTDLVYSNQGALSAMRTAKGVCYEYAALFAALNRAVGIPARVATGYWVDEALKYNQWNDISSNRHAWPEFYLPKVGWIPAEPTFFLTVNGVKKPDKEHFANIAEGDLHLLSGYLSKNIKGEGVRYSYYSPTQVSIDYGKQEIMPIPSFSLQNAFSDISGSWAKDYISKLYNEGILFAKQGDLYKPQDNITRAEFSAYLVNTLRLESKDSEAVFKDVNSKTDYADFIKTAAAYGLIKGNPQGYFNPNDTITREDAAVIMQRAIDLLGVDYSELTEPQFNDLSNISQYAKESVKLIYSMNIMSGKPGNIFDPKDFTTRAEASKLLDNFIMATE